MRVLMSAYACEPGKGSEPGVGWNMAKVMSGKVDLTVATRANNQVSIEKSGEDWVRHVEWIYYDPPAWITWWKKGGRGVQIFYILWQIGLYLKLYSNGAQKKYDLVHHVTFGRYWVPSFLSLLGVPFVFGSVGGGEYTPENLKGEVSSKTLRGERVKRMVAWLLTRNPMSWILYRRITLAYAATEQTETELKKLGVKNIERLPQSGISTDELNHYELIRLRVTGREREADFVACTAARLIPWKGVDIAIRAFIMALPELPPHSVLKIAGIGPELERLKTLVGEAGVEDKILFLGRLPTLDDVFEMMASSDCLLHAATSEAFGQACAEALGLGVPVVCWDWAGPGLIASKDCGVPVSLEGQDLLRNFADAIIKMSDCSVEKTQKRSEECVTRIREQFLWESIGNKVLSSYYTLSEG